MANPDTDPYNRRPDPLASPGVGTTGYDASRRGSSDAGAEVRETVDQVRHEAHRLAEDAKEQGRSLFEGQKGTAAEQIGGIADALRRTAQQLNEQDQALTARYVEQAAKGLDRMANTLRDSDLDSLIRQVEGFARRQPGVFLGGAVATGLLLSRFLKSSAERREADYGTRADAGSMATRTDTGRAYPGEARTSNMPPQGEL